MVNKLREMFENGEYAVGTFQCSGNAAMTECIGYAGLDWVVIDTEHGPFDTETMLQYNRCAERVGVSPVVRIADATHKEIQRAADCGADAIIIPCLRNLDDFKRVIDLGKFQPVGQRGFIKGPGAGYGRLDWSDVSVDEYMRNSNDKLMLIPQCETVEALEHIEEIAAMDGIDGIFIGPFDLTIDMGIPAQFDHPAYTAAVDRIIRACRAVNKPVYVFSPTAEDARSKKKLGMAGAAIECDFNVVIEAYKKIADGARQ